MSTDIEQRLRRELDQVTVRVPAGIVRRAHGAYRRRLIATRATAIAGTAIVIAVAATALAVTTTPFGAAPGGRPGPVSSLSPMPAGIPGPGPVPTPPGNGLTARQAARDILWAHTTNTADPAGDSMVENTFSYGVTIGVLSTKTRDTYYARDGEPYQDHSIATIAENGGLFRTDTQVDYARRTWSQFGSSFPAVSGPQPSACAEIPGDGLGLVDFAIHPDVARSLLRCPDLIVTRGTQIDGIAAIRIADHRGIALWVNAATYLPIKMVSVWGIGQFTLKLPNGGYATVSTTEYGYLAPTNASLGYLSAPLPHGFAGSSSGMPTGKRVPTWTPPPGAIPPFSLRPVAPGDSLTPALAARDIAWAHSTTQAIPASDTLVDNIFSYKSSSSDLTYYPDGKPWDEDSEATIPGAGGKPVNTHTVVNWERRTYTVDTSPAIDVTQPPPPPSLQPGTCTAVAASGVYSALDPAAGARSLLSCPGVTVTRGLVLEGVDAIRLTSGHGQTLWVNATTYLPIEAVLVNAKGHYPPAGYDGARSPGQVIQYSWLPPTPANLAYLAAFIPAGFTRGS